MAQTNQQIINDIETHINKCGGSYFSWYVGIAANAKERLIAHDVDKEAYIYRTAASSQDARQIERYFTQTLSTDGGTGGGDQSTNMVYAYKKSQSTNP